MLLYYGLENRIKLSIFALDFHCIDKLKNEQKHSKFLNHFTFIDADISFRIPGVS